MDKTKYYKDSKIYHKVGEGRHEKIYAFHYCFGIESNYFQNQEIDGYEITETQYNRVRKLIMVKLTQNV